MKINLPPNVIRECLQTSQLFREYIAALVGEPDLSYIVKNIMEKNKDNKIAAIKEIRELSYGRVKEFATLYPSYVQMVAYDAKEVGMGLQEAKKLVESFPQFRA